ncbi:gas vesicle protein GvpG [Streptomyces sp. HUAS MG91]|uniref:Gas vesicle protein GvpG n=1 Tax=Streptomyces tabacisoli TaxID=3156398 RepID=A0AAU8J043_9ACTN
MGLTRLVGEVLLLPLAPVRGSMWVMEQLVAEAERHYYDPAVIRSELSSLERQLTEGDIDQETFDRIEDQLLDRLEGK